MALVRNLLYISLAALALSLVVGFAQSDTSRLLQDYTTTDQRTQTVTQLCVNYPSRDDLVDDAAAEQNRIYTDAMYASFSFNGNQAIEDTLNGNSAKAIADALAGITDFILFVAAFIIGFVVLILIWTCLSCCCCCPGCCPSKCCQKNENEQYTKCELYWPTIVLILALLLSLVAGIVGLTKAGDTQSSVEAVACSAAIIFDDLINGNVTTAGTFFIGIRTLETQLGVLESEIGNLDTQLDNVKSTGSTISTATGNAATAKNDIDLIPSGSAGAGVSAWTYNVPINDSSSTGTETSTFADQLGSTATADAGTLVYLAYAEIDVSLDLINQIASAADSFGASISTFQGAVSGVQGTVGDFATQLQGYDDMFYTYYQVAEPILGIVTTVITAFFGVIVGLSILGILGAILMTFCDKYKCRYLIYFSCTIMFIIGIVTFIVAILFSLLVPAFFFSCQFIQWTIESSANFEQSFGSMLGESADYFSVCLASGSGDILSVIGGDTTTTLQSLQFTIQNMNSFDSASLVSELGNQWDALDNKVTNTYAAADIDLSSSSTGYEALQYLADPSNFAGCTANSFQSESWPPSILSGSEISCTQSSGTKVDDTECSTSANIQSSGNSCAGCIDSNSVLTVSDGDSGDPAADLKARYNGGGACDTWADEMDNVWTNYYSVKNGAMGGISTRTNTAAGSVATYQGDITTVGNTFSSTLTNLQTISSSLTDPDYGLVAGLNCRLFGEDLSLILNTFCARFFNVFYFLRLALGILSFGILFTMCCSVCAGVRHFKHSERKDRLMPENTHDGTMGNINAKY